MEIAHTVTIPAAAQGQAELWHSTNEGSGSNLQH